MKPEFILLTTVAALAAFFFTDKGRGNAFALAGLPALPQGGGLTQLFSKVALVFEKSLDDVVGEFKEIGTKLETKIKGAIAEVEEIKKKGGDAAEKIKQHDEVIEKLTKSYDKAVADLDEMAKKMSRPDLEAAGIKTKSFGEHLEESLTENKDQLLKMMRRNDGSKVAFETKAVGTLTMGNYTGGTMGLTQWDAEIARPERRTPQMRNLVRVLPATGQLVAWAEKVGFGEGGADTVAEGVKKPQKDLDFTEASKKVEKIAVFYKASKESLADIPGLRAEINADGVEEVNLKLDQQLLDGNGVAPNLSGIMGYAPTVSFAGTPMAASVSRATNLDVIFATATLIQNAFFEPNVAIVNNLDFAMFSLDKDPTTGAYLAPPSFSNAAGNQIGPVRVIPNPLMPQGQFLVGDFNRAILRIREELGVQLGFENDDFTRNLITIVMEMRAVHYIKSNHIQAFRKGVFATAKTAINKP